MLNKRVIIERKRQLLQNNKLRADMEDKVYESADLSATRNAGIFS